MVTVLEIMNNHLFSAIAHTSRACTFNEVLSWAWDDMHFNIEKRFYIIFGHMFHCYWSFTAAPICKIEAHLAEENIFYCLELNAVE